MADKWLNKSEVAWAMQLHPNTTPAVLRHPALKVFRMGKDQRVMLEDLVDFVVASTGRWGLGIGEWVDGELLHGSVVRQRLNAKSPHYIEWSKEREAIKAFLLQNIENGRKEAKVKT